ncbi:MAG: PH domain-containing protein [Lachnospiraceae bacterium]|nr:PH domain-containing protein [Lachnospiraceae bacterium]
MFRHEKWCSFSRILHKLTVLIGILSVGVPILFWNRIPDEIPMHYNVSGMADRYSDKGILIFLFVMILFLMGIMAIAVYCVKQDVFSEHAQEAKKSQSEDMYYLLTFMNFVIQCIFAYLVYCCAQGRMLGRLFMPVSMTAVLGPILFYFIYYLKHYRAGHFEDQELAELKRIESQETGLLYRSKVDWWLAILLGGTVVLMLWVVLDPVIKGDGIDPFMMLTTVVVLLLLWPLKDIKYVLYSGHMLVSCGFYGKMRIRYAAIRSVKETKNPLSSAALSLDRLSVSYSQGGKQETVLISPVRKKEFIKKLEEYRKREET